MFRIFSIQFTDLVLSVSYLVSLKTKMCLKIFHYKKRKQSFWYKRQITYCSSSIFSDNVQNKTLNFSI